ncbi:MAG: hypothetical protein FJY85_05655 [Deltaproteobacteria bacterium]|nr:hypothetical protein [Deltaproteobacteria bacterium]
MEKGRSDFTGILIPSSTRGRPEQLFLILGVLFPFMVIVLEFTTGFCAQEFFDPIPTL